MRWMKHRFNKNPRTGRQDLYRSDDRSFNTICPPPPLERNQSNPHRILHPILVDIDLSDSLGVRFTPARTSADGEKMRPRSIFRRVLRWMADEIGNHLFYQIIAGFGDRLGHRSQGRPKSCSCWTDSWLSPFQTGRKGR